MRTLSITKRPSGWTYKLYIDGALASQAGGFATRREAYGAAIEARCSGRICVKDGVQYSD